MRKFLGVVGVLMVLGFGWNGLAVAGVSAYNAAGSSVGNYATIQAGVDACPAGGKVSVSAGTYMETVYVNKGIALVGIDDYKWAHASSKCNTSLSTC
ncbi:MAG: hypothetical protein V1749_05530 [Candidatus Desantisbacteria bacterium]